MSIIDLHICKNSTESDETTLSESCYCSPEYYCVNYCGEGASLSTLISWQHFPRSTSSRSRCDDGSEEISLSVTETKTPSLKEEKKSTIVSSTEYPITKSFAQLHALHYLGIRYVFDFFNFLMSHLVCNEPEDPVQFLVDLLNKCLKFRDKFGEPPLLFTHAHVKSLYSAFDPFERGYLTQEQYHEAMKALGLGNGSNLYNQEPTLNEEGFVNESDFIFEADSKLLKNLKRMVRIPKIWEENRLRWKKRMNKRKHKKLKANMDFDDRSEYQEEEEVKPCGPEDDKRVEICTCEPLPNMIYNKNDSVQLFLD